MPRVVDPDGKTVGDEPVGGALNTLPGDVLAGGHSGNGSSLVGHLAQATELGVRHTSRGCDRLADAVQRAVQPRNFGYEGVDLIVHLVAHPGIFAGASVDNMLSDPRDLLAMHQLLALHGHLVDSREFDRLDELFTADVVYDVSALGQGVIRGLNDFSAVSIAFVGDERNPIGHHVTNIIVEEPVGDTAIVRSKGIGVLRDGRAGSVTYLDHLVRTPAGWRIAARRVVAAPS